MDALPVNAHALAAGSKFGDRGVLVFAAEFDFGAAHEIALPLNVAGKGSISPSLEAFLLPHLSLGAALGVSFESGNGAQASGYSAWPRVGYALAVARDLAFWPRAGVELSKSSITAGTTTTHLENVALALYAPLALIPLSNLEIGFGPTFFADLVRRKAGGGDVPRGTTLGLAIEIGGWL